jgi:hypothetical protein
MTAAVVLSDQQLRRHDDGTAPISAEDFVPNTVESHSYERWVAVTRRIPRRRQSASADITSHERQISQASNQTRAPPAGLAPGWLQGRPRIVVDHQGSGYPVTPAPEA